MKPDQLYNELKHLAEKLGIEVLEQNFRNTGIRVKSGFCKVKGKEFCIIDKHLRKSKKLEILAECLSEQPHESIYVIPAVREYLNHFKLLKPRKQGANTGADIVESQSIE